MKIHVLIFQEKKIKSPKDQEVKMTSRERKKKAEEIKKDKKKHLQG